MTLPLWPIVGRRPELEVFERALGSGERAGLVIYGRAGVGKTRLADECAAHAAAGGHPTQRVAGSRTTALLPLGAVVGLLPEGPLRLGRDGQVNAVAAQRAIPRSTPDRRAFAHSHLARTGHGAWSDFDPRGYGIADAGAGLQRRRHARDAESSCPESHRAG